MDVPSCLSANWWDIRACSTARASDVRTPLEGARRPGVAMIDLAADVCPSAPCPAVVDNMIVYRDAHHLTATFSASLGPELLRLINIVR